MVCNNQSTVFSFFRKYSGCYLACIVLIGYVFGIYTACITSFPFSSLMLSDCVGAVSIVRMLCVVLVPFLFTAIAVIISKPCILLLLLPVRAFLHSFSLYGICAAFSQTGWLVAVIYFLIPATVNGLLIWFSLRHLTGFSKKAFSELTILSLISVGMTCIWFHCLGFWC